MGHQVNYWKVRNLLEKLLIPWTDRQHYVGERRSVEFRLPVLETDMRMRALKRGQGPRTRSGICVYLSKDWGVRLSDSQVEGRERGGEQNEYSL